MKYLRHIAKSEDTKDWIRIEAEIKGKYAHQMTEAIRGCETDNDLKNLIINSILDHYSFYYVKSRRPHKITKLMLELLEKKDFRFFSPSPRDNTLERSIEHLVTNSGLLPTMYKIEEIWGKKGVNEFLDYIIHEYKKFKPNDDHIAWLRKRHNYYRLSNKPWSYKMTGENHEPIK